MMKHIQKWILILESHAKSWWYVPVIALLALADLFLIVIPTDGLLVSSVMLTPRRWIYTAIMVAVGSSIGAVALAHVLSVHGLPFLLHLSPGIDQGRLWIWTSHLMEDWGTWALFLIALSPMMQHPAIAIAAFAGMPGSKIFAVVLAGRLLKYLFLAWVATHAPKFLNRIWGMQYELEEVGLKKPKK